MGEKTLMTYDLLSRESSKAEIFKPYPLGKIQLTSPGNRHWGTIEKDSGTPSQIALKCQCFKFLSYGQGNLSHYISATFNEHHHKIKLIRGVEDYGDLYKRHG